MSKRILLVEDDPFLVRVYKLKLSKEGIDADYLTDGSEVVAFTKHAKPTLIILDLLMPIMDGFETLSKLKADEETKGVPVIVLTALQQPEDVVKTKALGAVEHLFKGNVEFAEVMRIIKKYLKD